jgi:hypothetical protein
VDLAHDIMAQAGQVRRIVTIVMKVRVRSEGLLMEQLDYNLLFRWFVGLAMDESVWVTPWHRSHLVPYEVLVFVSALFILMREVR